MIVLRDLEHSDYDDVYDICKDIWDGTDYLPQLFHKWVDDPEGAFIGAVDSETGKVIGTDKYSVLSDGTGWLEGIRIHKEYRGRKIAKLLTECVMERADKDLESGKIRTIAFSTHASAVESITMMKKYGFYIEQEHILARKEFDKLDSALKLSDFDVVPWDITYEEFVNLPYIKRRHGLFHIAFYFQKPTPELFENLKSQNCFVSINGHKGIYIFKGEPHFMTLEESFGAVDTFANYYLLQLKDQCSCPPLFSVHPEDTALIEQLKANGYCTWTDWQNDYYYFVKK